MSDSTTPSDDEYIPQSDSAELARAKAYYGAYGDGLGETINMDETDPELDELFNDMNAR